jgi:hypothetical protein
MTKKQLDKKLNAFNADIKRQIKDEVAKIVYAYPLDEEDDDFLAAKVLTASALRRISLTMCFNSHEPQIKKLVNA